MGKVKTGVHVCQFLGGPLDGDAKRVPDAWLVFRVPTLNTTDSNVGSHLYIRDEDLPEYFIYEGLE